MLSLAIIACSSCEVRQFAGGFNHIGWGPLRVMQFFVVVVFAWGFLTRNKPESPKRDIWFGVLVSLVLTPALIWSHLATLR